MQHVYKIINNENGKFYVGRSDNLNERWASHLRNLRGGRHHSIHLQRAWDKYGQESFCFEIAHVFDTGNVTLDLELAQHCEQRYLDSYLKTNNIYNRSCSSKTGVSVGQDHPHFGKKPTEWMGEEAMNRAWATNRQRIGEMNSFFGKTHSNETIAILKEKCAMHGPDNPFYGRKHTDESKQRMSAALKGKKAHNRMAVVVDGIRYESCEEAGSVLGIKPPTLRYRVHSKSFPNYRVADN